MLGSITPLGQRARGFRFWPTATAFIASSTVAGATFGSLLGALGAPVAADLTMTMRLGMLFVMAMIGLALDLRWGGSGLPTVHRQVNEEWLTRYRGPIFGAGFGFQLGLGVVTIVTTSAIYLTWAGTFLAGGAAWGALIGGAFGLARALPIVTVVGVRDPASLRGVQSSLARWQMPVRRATFALQSLFAVAVAVAVWR